MNDWKKRIGVLYSTNKDFEYDYDEEEELETLPKEKQTLRVLLDKNKRKGKELTIIKGFVGRAVDLDALHKELKKKIAVGGSAKDGEIILQGNHLSKLVELLRSMGYTKAK